MANGMSLKEKAIASTLGVILLYAGAIAILFMRQLPAKTGAWARARKAYETACTQYKKECRLIGEKAEWTERYDAEKAQMPMFGTDADTDTTWRRKLREIAQKNFIQVGSETPAEELQAGDVWELSFDVNTAVFKFGPTMMVCRLIVGRYPKYRDVIPQNNANILKIDRAQLLNTVKRVAVCANKASNHIKFDLKAGQVEITAQDLGFAIAAYEKLTCDYNGDDLTIGFKSSFLIEILSNMTCETVVMKFADARRAALIVPSEEEAESEKICGIIMPIMVS